VTVLIAISSVHDVLYNVEKNALKRNQESLKTSTACTGCSTGKQVPHKIFKKDRSANNAKYEKYDE